MDPATTAVDPAAEDVVTVYARLPADLTAALDAIGAEQRVSRSTVLFWACRDYVQAQERASQAS